MELRYYTPKKWDDLTKSQFIRLTNLLENSNVKYFDVQLYCILLTPILSIKHLSKLLFAFLNVPISEVLKEADFINSMDRTVFPEKLKVGGVYYYGPKPRMLDVVTDEFALAYFFFTRFINSKKESDLNGLVACLYRLKVGEHIAMFDKHNLDVLGKKLHLVDNTDKMMVFIAFKGSLDVMASRYKHVFKKGSTSKNNKTWDDVIHDYSELKSNGIGALKEVRSSNLYDFIKKLNRKLAS